MIGNLLPVSELFFAFRQRIIHFSQIEENKFKGLFAADTSRHHAFWRFSPSGNKTEAQYQELSSTMAERGRGRQRASLANAFIHHSRGATVGKSEVFQNGSRIPFTSRVKVQLRFCKSFGGFDDGLVNLRGNRVHADIPVGGLVMPKARPLDAVRFAQLQIDCIVRAGAGL